ncbi:hypothetical protein D3C76_896610 [compost metagenome]
MRLEQPEDPRIDLGEQAHLRQVAANQREVVVLVQLSQATDPLHGVFVTNLATQRVGGIGGIDHHPALADDLDRLFDQARLRVFRMNLEKLTHILFLVRRPRLAAHV